MQRLISILKSEIQYYQQNKDGHANTKISISTNKLFTLKNDQLKLLKQMTVNNIYDYNFLIF